MNDVSFDEDIEHALGRRKKGTRYVLTYNKNIQLTMTPTTSKRVFFQQRVN
jgi:hypothetical protein